jgi:putative tryptophan/tyrosine transport system substrate-binding protein
MRFDQMRRRDFITLVGGAATAWPLAIGAQPTGRVFRIGFLGADRRTAVQQQYFQAFLTALREHGFNEGQNLTIEYRETTDPRGPFVGAAELMRTNPDLIVVTGPEVALQAVVGASRAIPIVFVAVQYDPVERGYVASLARPGGNITGVFLRQLELAAKQLEILAQTFPDRTRVAVLWDVLTTDQFNTAARMATSLKVNVQSVKLENPPYDFEAAFRTVETGGAQMALVLSSPFFTQHRFKIAELASARRLPTMFVFRSYVDAGGLMSYGVDFPSMFHRAGVYVARILKGEKSADLPVEQATKFQTVVNLKTARAIGIELPTGILLRADEVIE